MTTLAAEFPNDNPALHGGAIWVCVDVVGAPVAELRVVEAPDAPPARPSGIFVVATAPEPLTDEPDEPHDDIVVEELSPLDELEDQPIEVVGGEPPPAPAEDDPFLVFVGALVDVALAHGAPEIAAALPALLGEEAPRPDVAVAVDAELTSVVDAWRGILRGTSEDWSATGGTALDDWAAQLLASLLRQPAGVQLLKRAVRARGVAAFGLVEAA